jgi:transcriptional regulator with XRE-family HTH domain
VKNIFMVYFHHERRILVMTIGERIAYLRNKKGLSQAELARQAHIGQSTLHGYESGTRSTQGMSVAIAIRIARVLGVTVDHLVGAYDDESEYEPAGMALVGS